jgi:hypothetical protein
MTVKYLEFTQRFAVFDEATFLNYARTLGRASRNFATRPACRALIVSSLRLRARLIVSAGLRTSPRAT